ncbi:protein NRT1/ PTR FAMILY 5.5-like [Salvia miltiorrhiza]|uniref:protein NRT1/ PTR FAMILY 5.5-like n=1 Tax=Salvia miltiorrhiza TaxID=226208 RepID=UPI0025AB6385|nr:protein NRT1/ PTR FAMILY 5.5-like [Salvia miltiorrhiza]
MKSSNRISALLWADILVAFALFVMQDYLTDVWNLSFTHAAAILNLWNGMSMVLQPFFVVLVDALLGNFTMLLISSTAYSLGIGFVAMSTPPVLGTCNRYEQECIGPTQKPLFYAGMALIAVGVAGNNVSLKPFLQEQEDRNLDAAPNFCLKIAGAVFVAIVALVGAIALPYVKPWSLRFGIPAICTVVATALFLTGLCCYRYDRRGAEGSQVKSLCRARMIPMLTTFVFCGVVSSVGNTYFVEQASNLNRNLGKWKVPPQVLLLAQKAAATVVSEALKSQGVAAGKGVVTAISFAVLCCITAARMELRRLRIVRRHGLLEKPDEEVPMSIFWLIFQFVLLACLEKFLEKSVEKMNEAEFPDDEGERRYPDNLAKGVSGLGFMCGVLSVYVVGEVSGRGGNASWFQDTLNTSRLDRYYWVLAALGAVNLFVYAVVGLCCRCFNR